ncbi:hypothetical protein H6M51_15230 [Rhizobium sp. AQ_MP]|uniref:hypothetical protein n=1 Tax=Rhizobium sp. AQ_MP TaxID=2761536 RepID=UPI001639E3B0|nr:hypothetical protein [Rhizobium sp. AQ_MP]MBC2774215.1 hypothetical protein [Rhizobium sp. AQ_MP]
MRRMWPEEFNSLLDGAEEVTLTSPARTREDGSPSEAIRRQALKVRLTQADFERIWPLAEARYRLQGAHAGKAITLIVNNPHYSPWHPADGGTEESVADSGRSYSTRYVVAHFLLDDVRETVDA